MIIIKIKIKQIKFEDVIRNFQQVLKKDNCLKLQFIEVHCLPPVLVCSLHIENVQEILYPKSLDH